MVTSAFPYILFKYKKQSAAEVSGNPELVRSGIENDLIGIKETLNNSMKYQEIIEIKVEHGFDFYGFHPPQDYQIGSK